QRKLLILILDVSKQTYRTPLPLQVASLTVDTQHRQRQMAADTIGQCLRRFIYHATQHGDVLAQLAADQTAVDMPEHIRWPHDDGALLLLLALLVQQTG